MRRGAVSVLCVVVATLAAACQTPTGGPPPIPYSSKVTRISLTNDGRQTSKGFVDQSITPDGRYVVFSSWSNNLVPGDVNARRDVFVRDLETGINELVSVASDGTQANHESFAPAISADGNVVAFASRATNLAPGNTDPYDRYPDLFIHDRSTGTTRRVALTDAAPAALTVANTPTANVIPPATPMGIHGVPSLSEDGRYVAFATPAKNLVAGDTNNVPDVFVLDRQTDAITRASVAPDGAQANGVSYGVGLTPDGRHLVFYTSASNLVADDANGPTGDIFVRDLETGTTTLVSRAGDGAQGTAAASGTSISADGTRVAFTSAATNLVPDDTNGQSDVFVRDLAAGTTRRASVATGGEQGDGYSNMPSISANGRYVAFHSSSVNLSYVDQYDPSGTTDVFVHDLATGETTRVSTASGPEDWRASTVGDSSISADGRFVVFSSNVRYLVPGDTNDEQDLFVWDREG